MKKSNMINVTVEFVIDALQARYDDVKELWGCDASASLWEQALQLVEDCGLGENITSPSVYIDNYLINGEFVSKDEKDWLSETGYDANIEGMTDEEVEQYLDDNIDDLWDEYCQDNALIYNAEYACIQF